MQLSYKCGIITSRWIKLDNKFIIEIRQSVEIILKEGNQFDCKNIDKAIELIDDLFIRWEDKIKKEHEKSFVTDNVENQLSRFATACAQSIAKNKEEVLKVSEGKLFKLFRHRHLGYGFYNSYDETQEFIKSDIRFNRILYHSLTCYFDLFHGKFYDNELAIEMLCEYYPQNINVGLETREKVASALGTHVKVAGMPGDTGYAYQGISKLAARIDKLPIGIIKGILKQYEFYKIVNDKVYRNQIFTIINFSQLNEMERFIFKFFFIDSVLLVDNVSRLLYKSYKNSDNEIEYRGWDFNKCIDKELLLWVKEREGLSCYWSYTNYKRRILKIGTKIITEIKYDENKNEIIITNNHGISMKINFNIDDWSLNKYDSEEFYQKLEKFFDQDNTKNNQLLFSHIWIDNYREIKNQQLSFDHNFWIKRVDNHLELLQINSNLQVPEGFYGKSIYSISAIIGENGAGKTSIINFLRDEFFKLIYLIDHQYIEIKDGLVQNNDYITVEGSFFIIFKVEEKFYFITNTTKIKNNLDKIMPYISQPFKKESEGSKLIYFSNMINSDIASTMFRNESDLTNVRDNEDQKKELLKSINHIGYIDFSESKSFKENNEEYLQYINMYNYRHNKTEENKEDINILKNKNFWYQVAFLDAHSSEEVNKLFGDNFNKSELILVCENVNGKSKININELGSVQNSTSIMSNVLELGREYLKNSLIKLEHFSAGQYAKFSFLSKLYWCLNGYERYHEKIENVLGKNLFDITYSLINNSTAVIFIDEGELYYHPEWQRTYISTLSNLIETYTKNKNMILQIIITSNSPFIISDINTSDIMFLPNGLKEKHILTFGSNIHTMLKNGFFMRSTIGEFAKNKIISTFDKLKDIKINQQNSDYFSEKNRLKLTINIVGDSLIKSKLEKLFNECFLDEISYDLISYQKELMELRKKGNDSLNIDINNIGKLKSVIKDFLFSLEEIEGEEND